jgi:tetratricopeptide (TPR) repeat protein
MNSALDFAHSATSGRVGHAYPSAIPLRAARRMNRPDSEHCQTGRSRRAHRLRAGLALGSHVAQVRSIMTLLLMVLCVSCGNKSGIRDVVEGFFDEVNHSNLESAKTKYLSTPLKSLLDSPPAFRTHRTLYESFGGFAGQIKLVNTVSTQIVGERATEGVVITEPWGTKVSGTVELIKEGGRDWKIGDWDEFRAVGAEHLTRAVNQCNLRNLNGAMSEYRAALAENSNDAMILANMGQCYAFLGDAQHAEQTLLQAIAMYPNALWDPYVSLGHVYSTEGKLLDAEKMLKKAIDNRPENNPGVQARLYNELAWFYADHGMKLDESIEIAQKALSITPDNANLLDTLGWAHYRNGDRDEATKNLARAAAKEPSNQTIQAHYREVSTTPAMHLSQAAAFLRSANPVKALAECDAALRAEPNNTQAKDLRGTAVSLIVQLHFERAQSLFEKQQYDQALSECNQALALDEQNQKVASLKTQIAQTKQVLGYR